MLLREGGEKKAYGLSPFPYPVVWSQKEGKAACFFTEEGLKRFLDGEDLPSFFNQNAVPLLRERKMELVKRYIERLERGEEPCRLLDSTKFRLLSGISGIWRTGARDAASASVFRSAKEAPGLSVKWEFRNGFSV